jgi:predicted nucleic acid-binding Zn finger protein
MRFRSFYPPLSYQGVHSNQWYVICSSDGDGWVKVNRQYNWNELEKLWDKIEYGAKVKVKPVKTKRKEYKVAGSKGNTYKVVNDDGIWTCSCPAHGFGRGKDCKHIVSIKNKK